MHILTWVIELDKQDKLLDKVSQKTHVSKEDILSLANDLQTKDLKDEQNIRDFVQKISQLTHKQVKPEQMDKIIQIIQNNKSLLIFKNFV